MNWRNKFQAVDWKDFYPEASELIPPNVPEPCGKCVQLNCFVDADYAGNQITRQSHSGVLLFIGCAPIICYSKQQNTVKTSTFGSEFIAAKTATEMIQAL